MFKVSAEFQNFLAVRPLPVPPSPVEQHRWIHHCAIVWRAYPPFFLRHHPSIRHQSPMFPPRPRLSASVLRLRPSTRCLPIAPSLATFGPSYPSSVPWRRADAAIRVRGSAARHPPALADAGGVSACSRSGARRLVLAWWVASLCGVAVATVVAFAGRWRGPSYQAGMGTARQGLLLLGSVARDRQALARPRGQHTKGTTQCEKQGDNRHGDRAVVKVCACETVNVSWRAPPPCASEVRTAARSAQFCY